MANHSTRAPERQADTNVYYPFGKPEALHIKIERPGFAVVRYTGTREDLIAAGAAQESMFPQGRKRVIYHSFYKLPVEERFVTRRLKGGLFCVERDAEFQPANLPPENTVTPVPWNPRAYREEACRTAMIAQHLFRLEDDNHRIDARRRAKILQLHAQIVDTFSHARIERRRAHRFQVIEGGAR